ncbi:FliH/SctL family protein [Pseudooceanicola sp. MF1-13]|uniref:FliH/SctL family protein n=1 Tax=Pseudooceanicola sp. MF1-13 TaxID=3379095 RepID=UPI003891C146
MSFVFDRDFDEEEEFEARKRIHEKRAIYTPEDLEEAVQKASAAAYEDGRMAGRAEASVEHQDTTASKTADTLVMLAPKLQEILTKSDQHQAALEAQVLDYVLTVARQLLPEILTQTAIIRTEGEIKKAIKMALGASSLRIHIPAEVAGEMSVAIEQQVQASGFAGRIQIQADHRLRPGDTRVEWDHGGMEFSLTELCDRTLRALRDATQDAMARRKSELE